MSNIHDIAKVRAEEYFNLYSYDHIERFLKEDNLYMFRQACNALYLASYIGEHSYEIINRLRKIANTIVRNRFGDQLSSIYDLVVKETKEELWSGDQLYTLYSFDIIPYYVMRCLKGALKVTNDMSEPVTDVNKLISIAKTIQHPPYWAIIKGSKESDPDERAAWNCVAEYLFNGNFKKAYDYIDQFHNW